MKKNLIVYDVLVVYSDLIAISASSSQNEAFPFSKDSSRSNYNQCYGYLLKECAKNNLNVAFTTTKDYLEDGKFGSHWVYKKNKWSRVQQECTAYQIFDKFSPTTETQKNRRKMIFADGTITPFNPPSLYAIFFDKKKTFDSLSDFAIPTVAIGENNSRSIGAAYAKLLKIISDHPNSLDFSKNLIMKDRFGAGGNNIYKISSEAMISDIGKIMTVHENISFVIQPFAHFNKGHKEGKFNGYVDIRLIYKGTDFIQSYTRKPKKDDFKCNEHQGGRLEYIAKRDVPAKVLRAADSVIQQIDNKNSLFALDFIISNSGNVYLMEGNSGPGIDWNLSLKRNERYAKKLIREIVKELKTRVNFRNINLTPLVGSFSEPLLPVLSI